MGPRSMFTAKLVILHGGPKLVISGRSKEHDVNTIFWLELQREPQRDIARCHFKFTAVWIVQAGESGALSSGQGFRRYGEGTLQLSQEALLPREADLLLIAEAREKPAISSGTQNHRLEPHDLRQPLLTNDIL